MWMMEIRLLRMVQDPVTPQTANLEPTEGFDP